MATNFPENPNPTLSFSDHPSPILDQLFMDFDFPANPIPDFSDGTETAMSWEMATGSGSGSTGATSSTIDTIANTMQVSKKVERSRVAFRTKTELEILDDGFKWRKYGKKSVKNSPNPRNYYKCSSGGCGVKKRVERDRDDPTYVITTYEGVHNHQSPSFLYCNNPIFP